MEAGVAAPRGVPRGRGRARGDPVAVVRPRRARLPDPRPPAHSPPHRDVGQAQSLVAVVLLLHVAINTLPGLWLPVASPFGYFRAAFALQAALLMQTVFACAAIVAAAGDGQPRPAGRGGAARVAGPAGGDPARGGPPLRGRGVDLASRLRDARQRAPRELDRARGVVPGALRGAPRGGLRSARGPGPARGRRDGGGAWRRPSRAACSASATPGGGGSYRYGGGLAASRLGAFSRAEGRPVARAVSSFVGKALLRSASAGLIARGFFVVGVALTVSGFAGLALRDLGYNAPVLPAQPLHAPAFVLPFFALVGLRLVRRLPGLARGELDLPADRGAGLGGLRGRRPIGGPAHRRPAAARPPGAPVRGLWGPVAAAAHLAPGARGRPGDGRVALPGLPEGPVHVHVPAGEGEPARDLAEARRGLRPLLRRRAEPRGPGAGEPRGVLPVLGLLLLAWRGLARRRDRQARDAVSSSTTPPRRPSRSSASSGARRRTDDRVRTWPERSGPVGSRLGRHG